MPDGGSEGNLPNLRFQVTVPGVRLQISISSSISFKIQGDCFESRPRKSPAKSLSRSPIRSNRSNQRSVSRSPGRNRSRRSYSRSPRSVSRTGSPKRIRQDRGFNLRYSCARRYRTPSPEQSPIRSTRYGRRGDRDRYSSYRSYRDRSPPRRYRSPPSRYRSRRSRSRSVSHSVHYSRYRSRRSRSRSVSRSPSSYHWRQSPLRSRSPSVEKRSDKRHRTGSARSPSRDRYLPVSRSPIGSWSPSKHGTKGQDEGAKNGLVAFEFTSPAYD